MLLELEEVLLGRVMVPRRHPAAIFRSHSVCSLLCLCYPKILDLDKTLLQPEEALFVLEDFLRSI